MLDTKSTMIKIPHVLRHFLVFTRRILSQTIFYLFIALDFIGILLIYNTEHTIPAWILYILPVIAVFFASFNVYRSGIADIHIFLAPRKENRSIVTSTHAGKPYAFSSAVSGYIMNYGPQGTAVKDIHAEVVINQIRDRFITDRMGVGTKISGFVHGSATPEMSWQIATKEHSLEFPIVLPSGNIIPFTIFIEIFFGMNIYSNVSEIIEWMKDINLEARYRYLEKGNILEKMTSTSLNTESIINAAKTHIDRYKDEKSRG
jgi:hypothetical protein